MVRNIAIIGRSGSGKDFLTDNIIQHCSNDKIIAKRFAFADLVKKNIMTILNLDEDQQKLIMHNEDFKNHTLVSLKDMRIIIASDVEHTHPSWQLNNLCSAKRLDSYIELFNKKYDDLDDADIIMTMRDFIVYYGTNVMQKTISRKIWCNALFNSTEYTNNIGTSKVSIITDVRFPHEYEECKKRGFVFVRVSSETENKMDNVAESYIDNFEYDYQFINYKNDYQKFYTEFDKLYKWIQSS